MKYYLELFLTRNCNQTCYYCSIYTGASQVEVDVDQVKYVLDNGPSNMVVELTGGEIGLITNIDDVFKMVYDHPHIDHIIALSNGLIRKRGVDWLDKVDYIEHLIKDIRGTEVVKFYDMDFDYNAVNIIVATEITTKSILYNWDHFKNTEFVTDKFFIKLMNDKTHDISRYATQALKLYELLGNERQSKMVKCFVDKELFIEQKRLCSRNPPHTYIDFDECKIGHCAIKFGDCPEVPFSLMNYKLLPSGLLFQNCSYCDNCYTFDDGKSKAHHLVKSLKGDYQNRSYDRSY